MSVLRAVAESEGTPPRALALADALDLPSQPGAAASLRGLLRAASVPRYRPERWNGTSADRINNNCYNYATDVRNDTFGQPGVASGVLPASLACADFTAAAVGDGLDATGSTPGLAGLEFAHVVALVIAPGKDFHWYRRDRDGLWSHKPGMTEATNLDNSDRPISDPRSADRWIYSDFCGFFAVPRAGVSVDGPGPYVSRAAAVATGPAAGATIVRLLVFSGRPNPEWTLEPAEAAELARKLASAERATRLTAAAARVPSRLGYRGFLVDRPGPTPGTRAVTTVHAGVVSDVRLTGAVHRRDAGQVEDDLLEQARRRGLDGLL